MASVRKKKGSKFWFACFTDKNGRRYQRSTKETSKREAQKLADLFEAETNRHRTARQTRRVLLDIHKEITGEELPSTSTKVFLLNWVDAKRGEVEEGTADFYKYSITSFLSFVGSDGERDIAEVSEKQIFAYRDHLIASGLVAKTVNHRLSVVRMAFKKAKQEGWIADDPLEFVSNLKESDSTQRRPFTVEEIRKVLEVAGDSEWRSMILFALYTGQRLSDLSLLRWSQIDEGAGEIVVQAKKSSRLVRIPICAPLQDHIDALEPPSKGDDFIHPKCHRAFVAANNASRTLSRQFGELLAKAGLREKKPHRKTNARSEHGKSPNRQPLSFHSFRHTTVSMMKNAGTSPAIVEDLVGHDTVAMNRHYTHIDHEAKAQAVASIPDVLHSKSES